MPPPLQVANNCPIGLATSKGKVIDTYDSEFITLVINTSTNHPQRL